MAALMLYGLKTCDTCRKAMKALDAAGRAYTFVDLRADRVDVSVLKRWAASAGVALLVNTRSTTWRGLDDETRARAQNVDTAAEVLADHPTLMKRPVIVQGDALHVGWTKAVQGSVL